ncbi:hypothetical protein AVEN_207825-1 [Araneus ventricosus]|uniref:Uncharacterized protein n=1 Tax=Araneus ventricosus TaxID=182803 RepID=A0A4Y2BYN3_ARAVE|nr:hypothetical protein AVEN_207825-1 [Araneus ventricosus]
MDELPHCIPNGRAATGGESEVQTLLFGRVISHHKDLRYKGTLWSHFPSWYFCTSASFRVSGSTLSRRMRGPFVFSKLAAKSRHHADENQGEFFENNTVDYSRSQ